VHSFFVRNIDFRTTTDDDDDDDGLGEVEDILPSFEDVCVCVCVCVFVFM
jgi:hypothetical protein